MTTQAEIARFLEEKKVLQDLQLKVNDEQLLELAGRIDQWLLDPITKMIKIKTEAMENEYRIKLDNLVKDCKCTNNELIEEYKILVLAKEFVNEWLNIAKNILKRRDTILAKRSQ